MNKELETITPRQLRQILFFADDKMTVSELRKMLYDVPEQDKDYYIGGSLFAKMAWDSQPAGKQSEE